MEPDVIRMYSSSPPPMEDGAEEEDDDFGDFGTFSGVPNSISFTEFETPTNFNQTQALTATSPPELLNSRGVIGVNGTHGCSTERPKTNGSALSERTEIKKVISSSQDCSVEDTSSGELTACNGVSAQVLTNGFDEQGSPSSQSSVHCHMETENPTIDDAAGFADFAAFSETEGSLSQMEGMGVDAYSVGECTVEQEVTSEETIRDINRTGSPFCDTNWQPCIDAEFQRDITDAEELAASLCTNNNLALNGTDAACSQDSDISPDAADIETGHSDEKGSGNETETETETSFGRLLSTDALEEYGDMSTTGSAPSPPLQGEPSTPADHSQLAEDDEDEDFGDFGEANSFGAQGFGECNHAPEAGQQEQSRPENSVTELEVKNTEENDEEFGDFNTPKLLSGGREGEDEDGFTEFPASDSFGNFSSAVIAASAVEDNVGWSAFGEEEHQMEGESWATFNTEQSSTERQEDGMCEENEEKEEEEGRQSRGTKDEQETSRTDAQMVRKRRPGISSPVVVENNYSCLTTSLYIFILPLYIL
uniref:Aftiphilin a n=1 Tax=Cynoglossus semilaevis TaxID=244447 RepID=A0A3P8X1G6_CYNSE